MSLYTERQERIALHWGLTDEIVVVGAGSPINKPGHADQCFEYAPHTDFYWLTGVERAGSVLVFDPLSGWELFSPPVTQIERVWEQVVEAPESSDISELQNWLDVRRGRTIAQLGCCVKGVDANTDLSYEIGCKFLDVRRLKDASEIALMRKAVAVTTLGHLAGKSAIKSGVTERRLQSVIESAFHRAGADGPGYHTIVGIGSNSAVFHFTPGLQSASEGDFVLFDAGASVRHYVADVTRTYVVGEMAGWQRDVYSAVNEAVDESIYSCKPGTKWVDVHVVAARTIAEGLRAMQILKCTADEAIETGAIGIFFPHGVGHAVGLGVRDAGGPWPRKEKGSEVAGVKIRVDFALSVGHTMTIEPGLYFIPALLNDPANREKFASLVNWELVEPFIGKGGVRLEDNVLITSGGCENLTAMIPR